MILHGDNMKFVDKIVDIIVDSSEKKAQRIKAEENLNILKEELENFFDGRTFVYQYEKDESVAIWQERLQFARDKSKGFLFIRNQEQENLKKRVEELQAEVDYLPAKIEEYNKQKLEEYIDVAYQVIGKVEGRFLDKQQMECVVKEPISQLVVAGAGTGKTTTIIGKVKYLLKMNLYKPNEILLLSFTKAAAMEMKERIIKDTGIKVPVQTIHSLGLNIIKQVDGKVPLIYQGNQHKFIVEQISNFMKNPEYEELLQLFMLYSHINDKSEWDFQSEAEYKDYLQLNCPTSIKNENMKSYGEVDIANFLAQHSVLYKYEEPYIKDTRNEDFGQYYPDFFLPEYGIYIEYFGINRDGNVPDYFKGQEAHEDKPALTPSQVYQAGMAWKRKLHKENNTILIECFAYEKFENTLLVNLKTALEKHGVHLRQRSLQEIILEEKLDKNQLLEGLADIMSTVINLARGKGLDSKNLIDICDDKNKLDQYPLAKLTTPVMKAYEDMLKENGAIDFADMLILATEYIRNGKFNNPFKYVVVDEYQDLSRSQYLLLKALRDNQDYHLMAVGDDWQSIYRFNGSDINYIVKFKEFWGKTEISRIETTYRFCQNLIDLTSDFIMQNPSQLKKALKSGLEDNAKVLCELRSDSTLHLVSLLEKELLSLPQNSNIFILGRYNFDGNIFSKSKNIVIYYDKFLQTPRLQLLSRPDLDIRFYSAHKSKGLQADYVFIINTKNFGMGFPSKVNNAQLIEMLLEHSDDYPFAEERRLFYVAMTRAKKKLYFMTINNDISIFVEELRKKHNFEPINKERFCPLCNGKLVLRKGKYDNFYGCSNYAKTGCKYKIQE